MPTPSETFPATSLVRTASTSAGLQPGAQVVRRWSASLSAVVAA